MGREFYYCSRCQTRLTTEDLRSGRAVRIRDQVACERCFPDLLAPLSLKEQEAILIEVRTLRERGAPAPPARPAAPSSSVPRISTGSTSTRLRAVGAVRPSGSGRRTALALILAGAAILLGVLAGLHFLSEPPHPAEPSAIAVPPAPPSSTAPPVEVRLYRVPATGREPARTAAPPTPSREQTARAVIEKARQAARAVPPNPAGALELYRKALLETVGTPLYEEVQKEIEEVQKKVRDLVAADLETLDREVRAACEKEEFGRALQILEKARGKYSAGEWTQGVDLRLRDVTVKHAWPAFLPIRDRALDARRRGAEDELRALRERVNRWGLPSFVTELERTLAAAAENPSAAAPAPPPPPPELKPLTEEARQYQKFWQEAVFLASAREYDAAVAALERAAERVREPDGVAEARADLEMLRGAASTWREALEALLGWPPGNRLPLEYYDESGAPRKLEAPLVRADAQEVEVMQGGAAVPVDLGEVTARSLAEILTRGAGPRASASPRALAIFCLLDGDVEAARRFLAAPSDQIPWKYWALGARIAEERANPASEAGRREIAARRLYFAAELERRTPRTRAAAIEKYRALLNDYADTAIVKRRRVHIAAQREAGREILFLAADLTAAGSFKPARAPKLGPCWTSESDSDPQQGRENTIDFSFYALPETSYRCWVYAGGCCQETFTFYYQTTDLTVAHPQTREILAVEPGAHVSIPVRPGIPFLKPRHELHGGAKEPKRWEWVAIPLPRYASAGVKTVRLLTEQKGFSVAAAIVSASRTQPPVESELRTWLRAAQPGPTAPEEPADASPRDPALAGHWKFEETGPTAIDSSGNDNTGILVNDPRRAPGRLGAGLALDGRDRYVHIPDSPTLRKLQEGDYTIAAWFKPNSRPPGSDPAANDGSYAIVMRSGRPAGLKYGSDQKFSMDHWLADGTGVGVSSAGTYPPEAWYHVAGVVSRTEGTIRIFVNGKADGAVPLSPQAPPFDFGTETWKIGIASPGAPTQRWSADGVVDDVRLYARALSANDVRILAGSAAGGPISVEITSPASGDRFEAGATLTVSASVENAEGRVAKVEFYNGSILLGMDATFPYVFPWTKVPSGVYTLTARAVDKSGAVYGSPPVTIRVGNAAPYRAIDLAGRAAKFDGLDWEGPQARGLSVKGDPVEPPEVTLDPPVPDPRWASLLRTSVASKEGTHVALNPVPNGSYQVYLYVWNPRGPQGYEILLKGRPVGRYAGGPAGRWEKLGPWFVDVTDGALDLAARGGEAHFSALEIWRVTR